MDEGFKTVYYNQESKRTSFEFSTVLRTTFGLGCVDELYQRRVFLTEKNLDAGYITVNT
jgi:hypothetical protein